MLSGHGVARYAKVAAIAALLYDPTARDSLSAVYLRELAADNGRNVVLRQTLRAYFAAGQNAASAAATLGVRDKTITNRLRTIEACNPALRPTRLNR
jgi:sugar diacid utilization regulator